MIEYIDRLHRQVLILASAALLGPLAVVDTQGRSPNVQAAVKEAGLYQRGASAEKAEFVDSRAALTAAKSLKCSFGPGYSVHWLPSGPKVSPARFDVALQFDSINHKAGTARMIGNQGATDVIVTTTDANITFIEETYSGNLIFTTVFGLSPNGSREFVVVTSRHMEFAGRPVPQQYHGKCEVWQ